MKVSYREKDFVFQYFRSGKLDTSKAWQKIKARVEASGQTVHAKKAKNVWMKPLRWVAVAASLLVLLAVGAYAFLQPKVVNMASASDMLTCRLPDGTQVILAPHSSLSYHDDDCRKVEMTGCAYFQVKHDEEHPFDVNGERGHVRVLGTQFQMDERTETPVVMVTHGMVFFSARDVKEGVLLTKGKQARLLPGAKTPELMSACDVNDVAWATHLLHFDNTPLLEVLQRLAEYGNGAELTATDLNKRLTGDFSTDSIDQAIRIIEQTLDVKITLKSQGGGN